MSRWQSFLSFLMLLFLVLGSGDYLRRDDFDKTRVNIYSRDHELKGYAVPDIVDKNRLNVFSPSGIGQGRWQRDFVNEDQWNFHR